MKTTLLTFGIALVLLSAAAPLALAQGSLPPLGPLTYRCVNGSNWHYCAGVIHGSCDVQVNANGLVTYNECIWIS